MHERYYAPVEVVRTFGVSPKALRLYEAKGLLKPLKDSKGWRAYGPQSLARLMQILALKDLGFSLEQISGLLAGRLSSLDAVLKVQESALAKRRDALDRALSHIQRARAVLASDADLSINDLIALRQDTQMTDDTMKQLFDPLIPQHFTPEEIAALEQRQPQFPQTEVAQSWQAVIADAKAAYAAGAPSSELAKDVARRWMTLVNQFSGGDAALNQKSAGMIAGVFSDPGAAAKMPFSPEVWRFVSQAWKAANA